MIKLSFIKSDDRKYNIERCLALIKSEIVAGVKDAKNIVIKVECPNSRNKSACTNKETLETVLKFIGPHLSSQIVLIGEAKSGNTIDVFKDLGYLELQERYDFTFADLNSEEKTEIALVDKNGEEWLTEIPKIILESDYLISIVPPKTDDQTVYTGIIRNSTFGPLLPVTGGFSLKISSPFKRNKFMSDPSEFKAINENIKKLYEKTKSSLAIVDAFEAMEGDGPLEGGVVALHWAIATTTPVAADCLACTMLGINYKDVGYLAMLEDGKEEYFIVGDDWHKNIKKITMHSNFDNAKKWSE